jgi:hypothetical protein
MNASHRMDLQRQWLANGIGLDPCMRCHHVPISHTWAVAASAPGVGLSCMILDRDKEQVVSIQRLTTKGTSDALPPQRP